jgi:hypothetical protein
MLNKYSVLMMLLIATASLIGISSSIIDLIFFTLSRREEARERRDYKNKSSLLKK